MRIDFHRKFPTRDCPNCGVNAAANQNRCPICAQPFLTGRMTFFSRVRIPAALLLLALMLWMLARGWM